jgi:hypothetical protein
LIGDDFGSKRLVAAATVSAGSRLPARIAAPAAADFFKKVRREKASSRGMRPPFQ